MKIELEDEQVEVQALFQEQGSVLGGTKTGTCRGFEIRLMLETSESIDEVQSLIKNAHRMCFTEDALTRSIPVKIRNFFNGAELDLV